MRQKAPSFITSPHKRHILAAGITVMCMIAACVGLTFFLNAVYAQRLPPAPPPIIGQHCGSVGTNNGYVNGTPHADDCLWHAYQASCQKATLVVGNFGIDAGTDYYLTVQPQHGICAVTEASQFHQDSGNITGHVINHTCGGLLHQFGGVVACGCGTDDNIVVPHIGAVTGGSAVPAQTNDMEASCGVVVHYAGQKGASAEIPSTGDPTSVTSCFAASWTTNCIPQQLAFVQFSQQSVVQETFAITIQRTSPCQRSLSLATESRTLTTPSSDIAIASCTGLGQGITALIITGCGTNPPLMIPVPDGTDAIINPAPPQDDHFCTPIFMHNGYRNCFWRAYQACQPVTISAFVPGLPATVMDTVMAQPEHGHCTLTANLQFAQPYDVAALSVSAATATCASAVQQDNEIVVSGCGDFGDIVIP